MLLFAAETFDPVAHPAAQAPVIILVTAHNLTDAVAETIRRTGYRPTAVWVLDGARRVPVPNTD
jgi:anthranilate phosphoribosyltransferase